VATTPRILIVDDEPQLRVFLSITFQRAGYAVKTASGSRAAIALCVSEPFDVILSDVNMPEMDGHQLAHWVAVNYPATRRALMSGFHGGCRECSYPPRCHLITKPFRPQEVVSFVGQVLAA
jgi:DNA-binding NtrC family response regulator